MKKIIMLILTLIMAFTLAACGSSEVAEEAEESKTSKEDMLAVAEECSATDVQNESIENIVRAKQSFCNKTLLLKGCVRDIKEDHIELSSFYGANYMVDVYLSVDDLVVLEKGQSIVVVGVTTEEIIEDTETAAGYSFDYSHYQMPEAYLVSDTVEVTGVLKGVNSSYAPAFNIKIGESNVLKLIYFAEGVDTSEFEFEQEITFSAKAINENDNWHYYEAVIIDSEK